MVLDLERRLGDPATRPIAIRDIAARSVTLGVLLHLAYDGDAATMAFLESLAGTPKAAELPDWVLYGLLGPRRRADAQFQALLVRLGIPRP